MMFFLLIYEKGRQSLDLIESSSFSFMATRNLVFSGSLLLMAHLKKTNKTVKQSRDGCLHTFDDFIVTQNWKIPQIRL